MTDHALINRLLLFIANQLTELHRLHIPNRRVFESTHTLHKTVLHDLQELIQACIDIGNHIISDENFRTPEGYREIFVILEEEKILSAAVRKKLEHMVGFRNLIVHLYEKIDLDIVYVIYKKHLGDFTAFMRAIRAFLHTRAPHTKRV